MKDLKIDPKLDDVHCFDGGDGPRDTEPYLWTVFFKVDEEKPFVQYRRARTSIFPTPEGFG